MEMAGGAILGYCAMGRVVMASAPISMMTMAITQAKTGRSIKKLTMAGAYFAGPSAAAGGGCAAFESGGRYSSGATLAPGFADWIPSTMTRSPGLSPEDTNH